MEICEVVNKNIDKMDEELNQKTGYDKLFKKLNSLKN
jgi:hypothetical protein